MIRARLQVVPSVTQCTDFVRCFGNAVGFTVQQEQYGRPYANAYENHKC
jgi:hypothetical protein